MNEIRTLLDDLAGDPPADLDLDRLVAGGRRRARIRGAATIAAGTLVVAVAAGGATALGNTVGSQPAPLGNPSPTSPSAVVFRPSGGNGTPVPGVTVYSSAPTARSAALATRLRQLVPELAGPAYTLRHGEYVDDREHRPHWVSAGFDSSPPSRPRSMIPVLDVDVHPAGSTADVICTSMIPADGPCRGVPRTLADGSTALVYSRVLAGHRRYAVRLDRADGNRVVVDGGIMWTAELPDLPALGPERLIEIGRAVPATR